MSDGEMELVDRRLNAALDELQIMVDRFRASVFKNETPFDSHTYPERIKTRLKMVVDISRDRSDVWRKVYRTREEIQQEEQP